MPGPGGARGAVSLRGRAPPCRPGGAGCAASWVEDGAAEGGLRGSARPQRGGGRRRGRKAGEQTHRAPLAASSPARWQPGEDFQKGSRAIPWWLSG